MNVTCVVCIPVTVFYLSIFRMVLQKIFGPVLAHIRDSHQWSKGHCSQGGNKGPALGVCGRGCQASFQPQKSGSCNFRWQQCHKIHSVWVAGESAVYFCAPLDVPSHLKEQGRTLLAPPSPLLQIMELQPALDWSSHSHWHSLHWTSHPCLWA